MPGGDRTGPLGYGPMSGRSAGYCAGYAAPGYVNSWGGQFGVGFGRARGRRLGGGRGFRRAVYSGYPAYAPMPHVHPFYGCPYPYQGTMDSKQEIELLQAEAEDIKIELDAVNKRITELKKENKD